MNNRRNSILYITLFALLALTAHAAQAASAKVVHIIGTVTKYTPEGQNVEVSTGDILKEGDSLSVSALSRAKLVFSNGSELIVEENSSLNITTLKQEPFSGGKQYEQLQADPSKSQTLLELNYGRLSGHVKQLRTDSKFHVETPLGTAAIRGTKFSVLLIFNAERREFLLTVKNFDGLVDIISRYAGQIQYGQGNIGDKGYDSSVSEDTRELIPKEHTVVIRLFANDPAFDDLFYNTKDFVPVGPSPVITPWTWEFDDARSIGTDRQRFRTFLRRALLAREVLIWIDVISPELPSIAGWIKEQQNDD